MVAGVARHYIMESWSAHSSLHRFVLFVALEMSLVPTSRSRDFAGVLRIAEVSVFYGESWCCIMQVGCFVLILRIYLRKPWVRWRGFQIRQSHKHPIFVPLVDEPGGPTSRVTHVLDAYPRSSDATLDRSFGGGNWINGSNLTHSSHISVNCLMPHVTTVPDHFFDFRWAKL